MRLCSSPLIHTAGYYAASFPDKSLVRKRVSLNSINFKFNGLSVMGSPIQRHPPEPGFSADWEDCEFGGVEGVDVECAGGEILDDSYHNADISRGGNEQGALCLVIENLEGGRPARSTGTTNGGGTSVISRVSRCMTSIGTE